MIPVQVDSVLEEYDALDRKLTAFRVAWNSKARKDLEYTKKYNRSKGEQGDFPEWWYRDVKRWRELKLFLNL